MKSYSCPECSEYLGNSHHAACSRHPANARASEEKCPTLAFNGINKQASEINSALDAENERLSWKLEVATKALRQIAMGNGLYVIDIAIDALVKIEEKEGKK